MSHLPLSEESFLGQSCQSSGDSHEKSDQSESSVNGDQRSSQSRRSRLTAQQDQEAEKTDDELYIQKEKHILQLYMGFFIVYTLYFTRESIKPQ